MTFAPPVVISSYRALYKAGLAAVQHSSPARYAVRDKIRAAFRSSTPSQFSQQRVDNTVEFLQIAAKRKGIEHDIVRNLCMVHYWQVMGKKRFVPPRNITQAKKKDCYLHISPTTKE